MGSTNEHRQIRLVRLAHVYYTHKDLTKASKFLDDFGFQQEKKTVQMDKTTIYYRGTAPEPFVYCAQEGDVDEFGGAAFVVESREDLEYASQTLPGASEVHELKDAPGGGHCVTFRDPIDGFPFHLVYGQSLAGETRALPQLKYNYVCMLRGTWIQERISKRLTVKSPRKSSDHPTARRDSNQVGTLTRPQSERDLMLTTIEGPAPVHKLGHFGMCVTNFANAYSFYTTRFNFKASDVSRSFE